MPSGQHMSTRCILTGYLPCPMLTSTSFQSVFPTISALNSFYPACISVYLKKKKTYGHSFTLTRDCRKNTKLLLHSLPLACFKVRQKQLAVSLLRFPLRGQTTFDTRRRGPTTGHVPGSAPGSDRLGPAQNG